MSAGGPFAQSFFQTIAVGQQIMQANADRREELDLRKKLVGAQLQEHDAKIALQTRQLEGIAGLRQRLQPQFGEEDGAGMQPAAPLSEQERMGFALDIDPGAAAKELLAGGRRVDPGKLVQQFMQGGGEQGGGADRPVRTGQDSTEPGAQQPGAPGDLGPQRKLDRSVTMSVGDDGKIKVELKAGERNVQFRVDHEAEVLPDGRSQLYRVVTNPEDPRQQQRVPVGAPQFPATLQGYAATATSWGLKPGSDLHSAAVADQAAVATTMQPGRAQEIAYQQLAERYRGLATSTPGAPPRPAAASAPAPGGSPRAQAAAEEVDQAAKVTKAKKEAEQSVPERASGEERKRLEGNLTSIDLLNQITATYKPEYVGPVRGTMGLISGGPASKVRERTGLMSQQEQTFRTNLATANNDLIKELSGANVPPGEMERVAKQLPDPDTLPPKQFEARLATAKLYAKAVGIRRRQILEGTGVDVSKIPKVTLNTEERRALAEPILSEYLQTKITREEAIEQLQGLSGYDAKAAAAFINAYTGSTR